jgi:hypothetical protein
MAIYLIIIGLVGEILEPNQFDRSSKARHGSMAQDHLPASGSSSILLEQQMAVFARRGKSRRDVINAAAHPSAIAPPSTPIAVLPMVAVLSVALVK